MRLTAKQIEMIRNSIRKTFGNGTSIWLFGSRIDDSKRGGDVDIYVEPANVKPLMTVLQCKVTLEECLDLHVDLIVKEPGKEKPIYKIAKAQGAFL